MADPVAAAPRGSVTPNLDSAIRGAAQAIGSGNVTLLQGADESLQSAYRADVTRSGARVVNDSPAFRTADALSNQLEAEMRAVSQAPITNDAPRRR